MASRITSVAIPLYPLVLRLRYFVEVQINGEWRDAGNRASIEEAQRLLASVVIVGDSFLVKQGG